MAIILEKKIDDDKQAQLRELEAKLQDLGSEIGSVNGSSAPKQSRLR